MNRNMSGFRWFSKLFAFFSAMDESSLSLESKFSHGRLSQLGELEVDN